MPDQFPSGQCNDEQARPIVLAIAALMLVLAAAALACIGLARDAQRSPNKPLDFKPPEPMLESTPQADRLAYQQAQMHRALDHAANPPRGESTARRPLREPPR